jgi:hypothetical protein
MHEELFALQGDILDRAARLVASQASAAERESLARMARNRQVITASLRNLPDGQLSYGERIGRARAAYVELDHQSAEIATTSDTTRAAVLSLEKYLMDGQEQGQEIAGGGATIKIITELKAEMDAMSAELDAIRREAVLARDVAGTGDAAARRGDEMRAQLGRAIAEERAQLQVLLARTRGRGQRERARVDTLLRAAVALTASLDVVGARIDEVVAAALVDASAAVAEEKAKLAAYRQEFALYEVESRELASAALAAGIRAVLDRFGDVILRAELGVIDVAWSRKEAADDRVQRLHLDRARELRGLQHALHEVDADLPVVAPRAPQDRSAP